MQKSFHGKLIENRFYFSEFMEMIKTSDIDKYLFVLYRYRSVR